MKTKTKKTLKVLMYIYVIALTAYLCASCSPCEQLARRCPPIEYVRDSIHVIDTCWFETIVVDTVMPVKLPPEYIYLVRPHTDTVRGETSFTRGTAWCDGESINLEMINKDSAEVLIQRIKTLERSVQYWKRMTEHSIVNTVYQTRGIVKVGAWIGLASVILLIIRIVLWILKKR